MKTAAKKEQIIEKEKRQIAEKEKMTDSRKKNKNDRRERKEKRCGAGNKFNRYINIYLLH